MGLCSSSVNVGRKKHIDMTNNSKSFNINKNIIWNRNQLDLLYNYINLQHAKINEGKNEISKFDMYNNENITILEFIILMNKNNKTNT